jgi:DNA invertase Pin-like site-specific DNA recombinase
MPGKAAGGRGGWVSMSGPSATLGIFLREFTHGHTRQLSAVLRIVAILDALTDTRRDLASQNTHAGLAAARQRGADKARRPHALSPDLVARIQDMQDMPDSTIDSVANVYCVSRGRPTTTSSDVRRIPGEKSAP